MTSKTDHTVYVKLTPIKQVCILDIKKLFNIDANSIIASYKITEPSSSQNYSAINNIKFNCFDNSRGTNAIIENANNGNKNDIIITLQCINWNNIQSDQVIPYEVKLNLNDGSTVIGTLNVLVVKTPNTGITFNDLQGHAIGDNMQSFMLLRTNPKLTGNIKLVVDSQDNLYLDTFKTSSNSILNDRRFRHQSISYDGNYAHDVKTVFSSIPQGELYGVYSDSYDPHKGYYKIENQKYTIYEYGAENNFDSLYSENMKILAPLHIGKSIPEYFCIFKTNHLVNKDTYSNIDINDTAVMQKLLKEGEIIKIFDLRNSTPIGHYLNAYKDSIQEYVSSSCYLQFNEQDNIKGSSEHRQGRNSWKGISVDKGILTEKVETSYFISKILEQNNKVQEDYNMFILQGYERNNLLYPNIINLEFMFDDKDAEDFSFHNYFGLYMSGNTIYDIEKCLINNSDNSTIDLYVKDKHTIKLKSDEQDKLKILKVDDIKISENNITFGVTSNNAEVINNSDDLLNYVKNKVVNKPQNIIAHIPVEKINLDNIYSFLTFSINTGIIMYGEHFRFVYTTIQENDNKTHYHIVDVIASNNDMYKTTANNVSLYSMYNNIEDYENDETKITDADGNEILQDGWYRKNLIPFNNSDLQDKTIHYTAVCYYSQDLNNPEIQAPLNIQFQRIQSALAICGHDIHVSSYSDNTIGFISNSISDIEFIHMYHGQEIIQNNKAYNYNINYEDYSINLNNSASGNVYITYDILFKYILPGLLIQSKKDLKFSVPCKFITKTQCKPFKLYQTTQNLDKLLYNIQAPLIYTQKGYELISFIKHMLVKDKDIIKFYYYPSPIDTSKYMFMTLTDVSLVNGNNTNIAKSLNMQVQIMGIHNVKDISMTLNYTNYDTYTSDSNITFNKGEIIKLDGSDRRLKPFTVYSFVKGTFLNIPKGDNVQFMYIPSNNTLYYSNIKNNSGLIDSISLLTTEVKLDEPVTLKLADYGNITNYNNITTSDPVLESDNYYTIKDNTSVLSIPVVPSINMQWESNGLYYDGNSTLNVNDIINQYTTTGFFNNNVYTPSVNMGQSTTYNISDLGSFPSEFEDVPEKYKISLKRLLLDNIYEYPMKKMLYSNGTIKTAVGYYNKYVQTLEFIYYGMKFIIKFTNVDYNDDIKLSDYNNYQIFMLNDYTGDYVNDIYISNKEQFILIINHSYDYNHKYVADNIISFNGNNLELPSYNFFELPYNIDLYNLYNKGNNMYITTTNSEIHKKYINSDVKYIIENDLSNAIYTQAESNINMYFNNDDDYTKNGIINGENTVLFINQNSYGYNNLLKLQDVFQNTDGNYRKKHTYVIKQKTHNSTSNVKSEIDKFISTFTTNDINMYIIPHTGKAKTIHINKDYKPVEIKVTKPNQIKYNHGFFRPVFKDVIEFETSEHNDNTDLLLGNTKIKKVNPIINYPCNKVYNNMVNIKENFFLLKNFNIFSTDWDNNIYRQYRGENDYNTVPGYTNGIIDKSLFGSKCIKLGMKSITLDSWKNAITKSEKVISKYNQHTQSKPEYMLKLNITKALHDYIISNPVFIKNWNGLSSAQTDLNTTYNNFIALTLNKAFDINNINNLKIYSKINNNSQLNINDGIPSDIDNYTLYDNYKTTYEIVNNEVILSIILHDMYNYDYYINLQIDKK